MPGPLALLGSGEYLPVMDETDRLLMAQARPGKVICLPTAAATEGEETISYWLRLGEEHFRALGADVLPLRLLTRQDAQNPDLAQTFQQASLIYFSGGKPNYLLDTLRDTLAWQAVMQAWQQGAALAGCSAGAMIFAASLPDFQSLGLGKKTAFGLLPKSRIVPHFDRMTAWRGLTQTALQALTPKGEYTLGIDEDTALLGYPAQPWQVMGRQAAHLIANGTTQTFRAGQTLRLD